MGRRDLFAAGSALVVTGLGAASVASAGAEEEITYVAGTVVGHAGPDVLEVTPYGTDVTVQVRLAPEARAVHRGNAHSDVSAFAVGDSIAFDVEQAPNAHGGLDDSDAGRVFAAVQLADCRPGTQESRGQPVG